MTANEIEILLAHKAEIDRRNTDKADAASYERWIADALEALLKTIAVKAQAATAPAKP